MRAYLDCFAGISGNMFLGALIDAGLPVEELENMINKLDISGYELVCEQVQQCGIAATHFDVILTDSSHTHRHLSDIIAIIDGADIDGEVKDASKTVFRRLAEAEARVHGVAVQDVHFHEVGAVDTIIDIVGTVFGMKYLGIDELYVSRLQTGTGFVECSHGRMPVPAPATAELLSGVPYYNGCIEHELVTPTGAALTVVLAKNFGVMPADFVAAKTSYGAGSLDLGMPDAVRLIIAEQAPEHHEQLFVIETNIDDMNPQFYMHVMDKLFADGAVDVWLTPIVMKKGRPAHKLSVLVPETICEPMSEILLTETTTIGVRYYPVERTIAAREVIHVDVPWGKAKVKVSRVNGRIANISPEYDDCKDLASRSGIPLKKVWQIVQKAGLQAMKL